MEPHHFPTDDNKFKCCLYQWNVLDYFPQEYVYMHTDIPLLLQIWQYSELGIISKVAIHVGYYLYMYYVVHLQYVS